MESTDPRSRSSSPELDPLSIGDNLAPLPDYKAASTTTVDFSRLLSPPLRLHEDLSKGCGGQLWPAGMVLTTHLLRHCRNTLNDAKMFVCPHFIVLASAPVYSLPTIRDMTNLLYLSLELGAGGGLVGLAITIGCTPKGPVYITDQENMLDLMNQNIKLNELSSRAEPLVLNWGDPLPAVVIANPPTHILAADCVYFEPAFPLLMQTLNELLELSPKAVIFFCFKKRRRADMQFLKTAKKQFLVTEVEDDDKPVWERQGLFLFTFQSRRAHSQHTE